MANDTAIATVAANVATALTAVDTAQTSAASIKFDAVVSFAALVAADVRKVINTGSNLETDAKGRIIALVDASKKLRADFAKALIEARGLTESDDDAKRRKDCENIASMGRTVSLHFVKVMIDNGSIRPGVAKNTDEMAGFIRESLLVATGDVATYNGIEQARARKWEAPEPAVDEADAATQEAEGVDPFAVEPQEAQTEAEQAENHGPVIMESADDADKAVAAAIAVLRERMAADDMERLAAFGFRSFLADALEYVRVTDEAEAEADAALQANG